MRVARNNVLVLALVYGVASCCKRLARSGMAAGSDRPQPVTAAADKLARVTGPVTGAPLLMPRRWREDSPGRRQRLALSPPPMADGVSNGDAVIRPDGGRA